MLSWAPGQTMTPGDARYQLLLKETREALARHYLRQTTLAVTEISFLLGFEELAAATREELVRLVGELLIEAAQSHCRDGAEEGASDERQDHA